MYYGFDTEDLTHAKAALLLYAMYRSREKNSSLNGVDTWTRFAAYVRGAGLKSTTTAEFVQEFCRKAAVGAIVPRWLDVGEPMQLSDGTMIQADGIYDYHASIVGDDTMLPLYRRESVYLTLLVRERIQRERMEGVQNED